MTTARLSLALLEWVADRTAPGQPDVDVRAWPQLPDAASGQALKLAQELAAAGLVSYEVDQHQLRLTPEGTAHVEQLRARRGNVPFRRGQARNAVLRWLYDQPGRKGIFGIRNYYDLSSFQDDERSNLDGVQFSHDEIRDAYNDLRHWGLATEWGRAFNGPTSSILYPTAMANGKLCVEQWGGDVAAYMDHRQGAGTKTVNYYIDRSPTVIGSTGVTQNNHGQPSATPRASSEQERLYARLLVDCDASMSPATKGYPSGWDDEARQESHETAQRRFELIAEAEALASAAVYGLWLQAIEADQEIVDLSSNLPWSPEDVAREIERSPQAKRRQQAREALRAQVRLELGRDPLSDRAHRDDAP
ncbi:hypothetical protein VM98_03040 [Streptomyces rubellomurinus subsp. indigoferus]|nr:hypothetical protein VM98_03040 [Streptomyces rubellomurinus subsp. indigoferus]